MRCLTVLQVVVAHASLIFRHVRCQARVRHEGGADQVQATEHGQQFWRMSRVNGKPCLELANGVSTKETRQLPDPMRHVRKQLREPGDALRSYVVTEDPRDDPLEQHQALDVQRAHLGPGVSRRRRGPARPTPGTNVAGHARQGAGTRNVRVNQNNS